MVTLRILLLALGLLFGAWAAPATAQSTAYAGIQGGVSRIEVGIDVRASVRGRCGFAASAIPAGTVDQAEFDRVGLNRQFDIRLDCTGASRIAVRSANGGLAHADNVAGYAKQAPYTVELRMVADNGSTVTAACAAANLTAAGTCAFGGTAGTANGLRLGAAATRANGSYLRVTAPPYAGNQPLLAGIYSDTLVVTVSIAP